MVRKPTEERNERTSLIDEMDSLQIVEMMHKEDEVITAAVNEALPQIAKAVDAVVKRWIEGGRVYVIGAGTSGRVGMLDAVELGPTFSVETSRWTAIVSGGNEAMWQPLEETEDDADVIRDELESYQLNAFDCVIGLTASGSTPFVISGLSYAKEAGACAISISNNQNTDVSEISDVAIELITGPEVIRGSTRLKAGTAQKMALNMISTAVMIRLGKVYQNEMVDMKLINLKLKKRAENILIDLTGIEAEAAESAMHQTHYNLKEAIFMTVTGSSQEQAAVYIDQAEGKLKLAIQRFFLKDNR
ncbi:N-acetylmuramic acid 6-phosphate etherase [Peribacillus frigoritolerans]|uniref:N-acetylmuramic acid 6-phosphate etherase n=1 Tax=Peribacillus frigoritolerans TaxID=450367 RepID=UPI00105A21B2|nr:N-acetylmuramic acid 6-phosphate etherase [Peribacillus frigoritolerans]TDL80332.1 N-acetylmuramic acid 6-phosphate etherase [Peribacillus frigoritolerans]